MKYTIEDLSPVKKSIAVTVPVEEVDSAVNATVAMYSSNVKLDGFRKGKAPASTIEKRYRDDIYNETTRELINLHIENIFQELKLSPLTGINFDGGNIERGKAFTYTISFEVLPQFDLPAYEGMEVEQEKVTVEPAEIDKMLERIRQNMAELQPIAEPRKARDGDVVTVDFEGSENGVDIPELKAEFFQMAVGDGNTLPDFETIVKTAGPNERVEGKVTFPADFINTQFAGKTVDLKVFVHNIQERHVPEFDEAMAQRAGMESMDKLRAAIEESYVQNRGRVARSMAQKALLERLLGMTDFPLPEGMVEGYIDTILDSKKEALERQGKRLDAQGKSMQELRDECRKEAEDITRAQVFLLTVAEKEKITVNEQEVEALIYQMASRNGQDPKVLRDYYMKNNMIFALRDRLLADKAMDIIHSKAAIKEVESLTKEEDAKKSKTAKAEKKAADAKADAGEKAAPKAAKKPKAAKDKENESAE